MSDLLRSFARDFAALVDARHEQTALVIPAAVDPTELSYGQLSALINRCSAYLAGLGLKPGDTILAMMPNTAETAVLFLSAMLGGYRFAPLPCIAVPREIEKWIQLVRPAVSISTDLVLREAREVLERAGKPVVALPTDGSFSWLPVASADVPPASGGQLYLSTSGTTGDPKAIVLDADRLWSAGWAFGRVHRLEALALRFWNFLPMSYLGGLFNLLLIPLSAGGSAVLDDTFSGRTMLAFWQTIERFDINAVWFAPTIVRGLLGLAHRTSARDRLALGSRIQKAFVGMAPIQLDVKRRFAESFGVELLENFALSETTFITSEADPLGRREEGSVGGLLPYAKIRFAKVDQAQDSLQEILIRSPFLFLGYLLPDGSLSLPSDAEGYFPTGDLGHLNGEGTLVLDGRCKDIIKKGGYLVPLRELEVVAEQHPAVREAAAVVVEHDFYGESVDLYVVLAPGHDDSATDEVAAFVRKNLVKYKWPERVLAVAEFPKTPGGKVQKRFIGTGRKGTTP